MTKDNTFGNSTTRNLVGAGLGTVLLAAPWLDQTDGAPVSVAGAVFLGALLVLLTPAPFRALLRLGFPSGAAAAKVEAAAAGTPHVWLIGINLIPATRPESERGSARSR